MAEMSREVKSSGVRRVWTALAAMLAFLMVGYALAFLVVGGYSAAFDKPASPLGVVLCLVLTLVPFIVGIRSYRTGRRRGLAGDPLVRRVSLVLVAVAFALLIALVLLAGPV